MKKLALVWIAVWFITVIGLSLAGHIMAQHELMTAERR